MAIDHVCKMEVDPAKAAVVHEYQGDTYYFCALGCLDKFVQNPERYIGEKEGDK